MTGAVHVSSKMTRVSMPHGTERDVIKEAEVSKQSTNMPESPTFRGAAGICAG